MNPLLPDTKCMACQNRIPRGKWFCPVCGRSRFLGVKQWEFLLLIIVLLVCIIGYSVSQSISLLSQKPIPTPTLTSILSTPTIEASATPSFTPLPSKTPTQRPSATTSIDPVAIFDWTKCRRDYETRLKINDEVTVGSFSSPFGYNVLNSPYIDRNHAGSISSGDRAKVIDGPSCSNRWIWWKIALEKDGTSGWIPEGDSNSYWLLPESGGQTAPQTEYARISGEIDFVSLRRSPGYVSKNDNKDVIVEIPSGQIVEIVRGPESADGIDWWFVGWNTYSGWVAEKTGSGKLILIFSH